MDFFQLLNEVKMNSDSEVKKFARTYGINLTTTEISALRPLLDDISFHWVFTGIPESFMTKVQQAIGYKKADLLYQMYLDAIQSE